MSRQPLAAETLRVFKEGSMEGGVAPSGHMAMITAGQSSHSPHVADRPGPCEEQAGRPAGRQAGRTRRGGVEGEEVGGQNQTDTQSASCAYPDVSLSLHSKQGQSTARGPFEAC